MANIESIAPLDEFLKNADEGWISLRGHKQDADMVIANYTPAQTFRNHWDAVTLASRGLIFSLSTGDIIARPFRKFFNAGQPGTEHIDTSGAIEVFNKEDGSMGIAYLAPDGEYSVSTRGSMHSEQAEHATEVMRTKYNPIWTPDEDYSFIFEIIYREGRIVVDYGDMDDLILLGAVNKKTGFSVSRSELESFGWPGPIVRAYAFPDYASVFKAEQERNREGFVVRFADSDERLKIKFEEYLSIHRLMFNLSPRRVWENLSAGINVDDWLSQLPDEFTDEAKGWRDTLHSQFDRTKAEAKEMHDSVKEKFGNDRKAIALHLQAEKVPSIIFTLVLGAINGRDEEWIDNAVWNYIDPRNHKALWES